MGFMINITKTICDKNGKKILKYPENTLLDTIINDLWNDIIRYIDYHTFAIGFLTQSYSGYRAIRREEFSPIQFRNYYIKNKGIPDLTPKHFCFSGLNILIDKYYTSLNDKQATCRSTLNGKVKIYNNEKIFDWYSVLKVDLNQGADMSSFTNLTIFVPDISSDNPLNDPTSDSSSDYFVD
jgi:hypothetical protein